MSLLLYVCLQSISELIFFSQEPYRSQSELYVVLLWVVPHIASVMCTHVVKQFSNAGEIMCCSVCLTFK